jgi:hypothetical protein
MTSSLISTPMSAAQFLFGADPATRLAQRLDESGALDKAREDLGVAGDQVWAGARKEVAGIAADFCALDLGSVLVSVWRKHQALLDAATTTRTTGGAVVVPLGDRRVSLAQHPRIDMTLGKATVAVIRFELAVQIDVRCVSGVVRSGALVGVGGGRCDATVSFGASGSCLAKRTAAFDPGFALPLGGGIVLALPEQRQAGRSWRRRAGTTRVGG